MKDVKTILEEGEMIREYPEDKPYPSFLLLGFVCLRPLHLVVSKDPETENCIMVTIYEPDSAVWSNDFKTKNK